MKAIIYENYGAPEVLQLKEIDKPLPKDNEVLIRVYATSVSSGDVRLRKADPFAVRFMLGLRNPGRRILGFVFAGVVEAVDQHCTRFKVGDQVYGTSIKTFGTYAEYICLPENAIIAKKPASLTYEEAASIPFGASTALHFLRRANIQSGQ